MVELDSQLLEVLPEWLERLPDDARALSELLEDPSLPEGVRARVAAALNYLMKSLDLLLEGIEDLVFTDDAFVLRTSAASCAAQMPQRDAGEPEATFAGQSYLRLASEAELIERFLGPDYARLRHYTDLLERGTARGRSVDAILANPALRDELTSEIRAWAASYVPPSFRRDPKNLVKVRAYLAVKLPGG